MHGASCSIVMEACKEKVKPQIGLAARKLAEGGEKEVQHK